MTENLPAEPTRQAIAVKDRSAPGRVTGKLKTAIERMVWFGDARADAATAAGLTDHGLRTALRKPHVLAYLRSELALLREGERPRSIHRLIELREQDENRNAAVKAIQVLEELTEGPRATSVSVSLLLQAGYVIDLSERGTAQTIEHEPQQAEEASAVRIAKSVDENEA
jgi:alcohol dehydrogenase class IV